MSYAIHEGVSMVSEGKGPDSSLQRKVETHAVTHPYNQGNLQGDETFQVPLPQVQNEDRHRSGRVVGWTQGVDVRFVIL